MMNERELRRIADRVRCRMIGIDAAGGALHRTVLASLAKAFNSSDAMILCEPTLVRSTHRPPDCVVLAPDVGVQVVEVKQMSLDQVEAIAPGGELRICYASGMVTKNVVAQVRNAMFDIRDSAQRLYAQELTTPFHYWVAFPQISRGAWLNKWGEEGYCPKEFLFVEDLVPERLVSRFARQAAKILASHGLTIAPRDQLQAILRALGDSTVLFPDPVERARRKVAEGTLGERFDDAADGYKALSDEQQLLSSQNWDEGPRLIRGVAGSGKTIVLANNLARRMCRDLNRPAMLYGEVPPMPRLAAVCFNRTLVPFLRKKIGVAYRQRTGKALPEHAVDIFHLNDLMWDLHQKGLWRYQPIDSTDEEKRAHTYLRDLEHALREQPHLAAYLYDAIYVDEGQDFCESDFRLLSRLCRPRPNGEINLYVFYDDAQNLYGRSRPNWQSLGINMRGGRASVMTQCFRNTRQIVEPAFNVLYGTGAETKATAPRRDFGDLTALEEKGLLTDVEGLLRVGFVARAGMPPHLTWVKDPRDEEQQLLSRLRWLLHDQEVRPEDVLVLTMTTKRATQLGEVISNAQLPVEAVHVTVREKDRLLGERKCLSVSTVASAKGYDKYCVLLTSVQDFQLDVCGRASFYVGCTRAIECLELFGHPSSVLMREFHNAMSRLGEDDIARRRRSNLVPTNPSQSRVLLSFWERFTQALHEGDRTQLDDMLVQLTHEVLRDVQNNLSPTTIVRILSGSSSARVAAFRSHPLFGCLAEHSVNVREIRRTIRDAVRAGRLRQQGRLLAAEQAAAQVAIGTD